MARSVSGVISSAAPSGTSPRRASPNRPADLRRLLRPPSCAPTGPAEPRSPARARPSDDAERDASRSRRCRASWRHSSRARLFLRDGEVIAPDQVVLGGQAAPRWTTLSISCRSSAGRWPQMSLPPAVECLPVGLGRLGARAPRRPLRRRSGPAAGRAAGRAVWTRLHDHPAASTTGPTSCACSISVSRFLTISVCFLRVSSPVSGLPSRCSTSRISLMISPSGPAPLCRRRPFFFRFRPGQLLEVLVEVLVLAGEVASDRADRASSTARPASVFSASPAGRVVDRPATASSLGLAELLEQVVERLVLGGAAAASPGFVCCGSSPFSPAAPGRLALAGPRPESLFVSASFFAASACRPSCRRRPRHRSSFSSSESSASSFGAAGLLARRRRGTRPSAEAERDGHDRESSVG